jgi:NAD(P) transhydrogenase
LRHIGQAVLVLNGNMDYFIDTAFNDPAPAECYEAAAFNGLNKLSRY